MKQRDNATEKPCNDETVQRDPLKWQRLAANGSVWQQMAATGPSDRWEGWLGGIHP